MRLNVRNKVLVSVLEGHEAIGRLTIEEVNQVLGFLTCYFRRCEQRLVIDIDSFVKSEDIVVDLVWFQSFKNTKIDLRENRWATRVFRPDMQRRHHTRSRRSLSIGIVSLPSHSDLMDSMVAVRLIDGQLVAVSHGSRLLVQKWQSVKRQQHGPALISMVVSYRSIRHVGARSSNWW